MLIPYTVPCLFVDRVQKRNCYLTVSTLRFRKISGTLFVFCFSLNMIYLPFCRAWTWKCINHACLVAVYTLNTPRTQYSLCITTKNVTFTFHGVFCLSKHKSYLFPHLQTSIYVRRCLTWYFLGKYVITGVSFSFTCNCSSRTYFVAF